MTFGHRDLLVGLSVALFGCGERTLADLPVNSIVVEATVGDQPNAVLLARLASSPCSVAHLEAHLGPSVLDWVANGVTSEDHGCSGNQFAGSIIMRSGADGTSDEAAVNDRVGRATATFVDLLADRKPSVSGVLRHGSRGLIGLDLRGVDVPNGEVWVWLGPGTPPYPLLDSPVSVVGHLTPQADGVEFAVPPGVQGAVRLAVDLERGGVKTSACSVSVCEGRLAIRSSIEVQVE